MRCPACLGQAFRVAIGAGEIARQVRLRERLVLAADPEPLPDRTRFVQNDAVDICACSICRTLQRNAPAQDIPARYASDRYGSRALTRMFDAYVKEFRRRGPGYRPLLPRGAEVLEVGSYVGAFLHVAGEWGWNAAGVDIGAEVCEFANSRGLPTLNASLEACRFGAASFSAVFIWNCFEQVPGLDSLLSEAARILKPAGLLVLRTPNALFYRACTALGGDAHSPAMRALGRHNLLGFPFLYGFGPRALDLLMQRNSFSRRTAVRPHPLVPLSFAPWLELIYRAAPDLTGWNKSVPRGVGGIGGRAPA